MFKIKVEYATMDDKGIIVIAGSCENHSDFTEQLYDKNGNEFIAKRFLQVGNTSDDSFMLFRVSGEIDLEQITGQMLTGSYCVAD